MKIIKIKKKKNDVFNKTAAGIIYENAEICHICKGKN